MSEQTTEKKVNTKVKNTEHPVWKVLDKSKFVESSWVDFEKMYDFINNLVKATGNTTVDGKTVPTMRVFFDMWNNSSEVFRILNSLVHDKEEQRAIHDGTAKVYTGNIKDLIKE